MLASSKSFWSKRSDHPLNGVPSWISGPRNWDEPFEVNRLDLPDRAWPSTRLSFCWRSLSPSLLKRLLKGRGGCNRITAAPAANRAGHDELLDLQASTAS